MLWNFTVFCSMTSEKERQKYQNIVLFDPAEYERRSNP